jgi:hypothetical protein
MDMAAINEAATQTVSDLFGRNITTPNSYYRSSDDSEAIDPELMQAAREVFFSISENKDRNVAISEIRKRAVEAINSIEQGEDPVSAVREEDDRRAKMVRIGSHVTEKTSNEVHQDLLNLGMAEIIGISYVPKQVLRPIINLDNDSDFGLMLFRENIKSELVEPTEDLVSLAEKPMELVEGDYWLDKRSEEHQKALEFFFGNNKWTDPKLLRSSGGLYSNMMFTLETYLEVIEMGSRRAMKLESMAEELEKRSEELYPRFENEDFKKDVKKIHEDSKKLREELQEVKKSLDKNEEMVEIAIKKLEELNEN